MTDVEALVAELARLRELIREQAVEAARERAQADAVINRLARERQTAAHEERAAVAAYLREQANEPHPIEAGERALSPSGRGLLLLAASRVEDGEHRREVKP
jgi:hypothetical protein